MRVIYRFQLLTTRDELLYQKTLDILRKDRIKYKTDIDYDRYSINHNSTAAGSEVMGRSMKPNPNHLKDATKYEIYVKPKDKEKAVKSINKLL